MAWEFMTVEVKVAKEDEAVGPQKDFSLKLFEAPRVEFEFDENGNVIKGTPGEYDAFTSGVSIYEYKIPNFTVAEQLAYLGKQEFRIVQIIPQKGKVLFLLERDI